MQENQSYGNSNNSWEPREFPLVRKIIPQSKKILVVGIVCTGILLLLGVGIIILSNKAVDTSTPVTPTNSLSITLTTSATELSDNPIMETRTVDFAQTGLENPIHFYFKLLMKVPLGSEIKIDNNKYEGTIDSPYYLLSITSIPEDGPGYFSSEPVKEIPNNNSDDKLYRITTDHESIYISKFQSVEECGNVVLEGNSEGKAGCGFRSISLNIGERFTALVINCSAKHFYGIDLCDDFVSNLKPIP